MLDSQVKKINRLRFYNYMNVVENYKIKRFKLLKRKLTENEKLLENIVVYYKEDAKKLMKKYRETLPL